MWRSVRIADDSARHHCTPRLKPLKPSACNRAAGLQEIDADSRQSFALLSLRVAVASFADFNQEECFCKLAA